MAEPESIDINEFAARLEALDNPKEPADVRETADADPEHAAEQAEQARVGADGASPDAADAVAEGDDVPDAERDEQSASEADGQGEEPPEFWSAEDKAFWKSIPVEVQPLVKKYEQQRIEFANAKAQEAAAARQAAEERARKVEGTVEEAAKWWAQAAPALNKAFADKWAQVDWNDLAANNPGEWARLNQLRQNEHVILQEANRRGQEDMRVAQEKAERADQEFRVAEHQKVAKAHPEFFGTPEKAQDTYNKLSKFLVDRGIPADRVKDVKEAPIIEIVLDAWRYRQAKAQASASTSSGVAANTAKPAPTRIPPGPAARSGNRTSEAIRQAKAAFQANNNDMDAAAEYLRRAGL